MFKKFSEKEQRDQAVLAAMETLEEGIFSLTFSEENARLVRACLRDMWEAAFEFGQKKSLEEHGTPDHSIMD